jgi:hypothetical protein
MRATRRPAALRAITALAVVIALPGLTAAEELFQSAPGPDAAQPTRKADEPYQSAPGPVAVRPNAVPRPAPAVPLPALAPVNADRTVSAHAPSGVTAAVGMEGWFDDNCVTPPIDIRIVEPPRRGTATVRDEDAAIPANSRFRTTPPACIGRVRTTKRIYYQSNPGFRGVDRIGYVVSIGGGEQKRIEIEIGVE